MDIALKLIGIAFGLWVVFHIVKETSWRKMSSQTHDSAFVLMRLAVVSSVAGLLGVIGLVAWSMVAPLRMADDFTASVSSVRQYAASFKGVSLDEARSRLAESKISESDWKERGYEGRQLVGTFPSYRVRVLFSGDKAIVTSIEITSK